MAHKIYTMGTSNLTVDAFYHILKHHGVTAIVDVRSSPRGWNPALNRDRLEESKQLEYFWMGDKLGGLNRSDSFFENRESDLQWDVGIYKVIELVHEWDHTPVILCAEGDPYTCHRLFIAKDLIEKGMEIEHLRVPKTSKKPQKPATTLKDFA